MPTATSPGVAIEEGPGGDHPITGVATSITAFVGATTTGAVNEPVMCGSFTDFERLFGGLAATQPMSYAVNDFFVNGGTQALIVRVVAPDAHKSRITLSGEGGDLVLEAASVGRWGSRLSAAVEHVERDVANAEPPQGSALFNLLVRYQLRPGHPEFVTERFLNLSVDPSDPRFVTQVLEDQSSYVRVFASPSSRPNASVASGLAPGNIGWTRASGGDDGSPLTDAHVLGVRDLETGLYALRKADLFNLLCIPPKRRGERTGRRVYRKALAFCVESRAVLIVDPDQAWGASAESAVSRAIQGRASLGLSGTPARNAALYFPCLRRSDPLRNDRIGVFVPCGSVAGVIARTDMQRGVWKAPAGLDAALTGSQELQVNLNDAESGQLNPLGINCLRTFPAKGLVVWGARTLSGADQEADEYKYLPVRRLALFIEESVYRGTQWAVFEPNDEALWGQVRRSVGAFMQRLFQQGALQGMSPHDAYVVKCDAGTTTQDDIAQGRVNILVGFAPLRPAEFVIIQIQQLAGQAQA